MDAGLEVIEQGAQRADVENCKTTPALGEHAGEDREEARLRLPSGGRGEQQYVLAREHRCDRLELGRAHGCPAQGVDNVVAQRRVERIEGVHSLSSMSSTERAPAPARSAGVISSSASVGA
jgi:hypothetical protein